MICGTPRLAIFIIKNYANITGEHLSPKKELASPLGRLGTRASDFATDLLTVLRSSSPVRIPSLELLAHHPHVSTAGGCAGGIGIVFFSYATKCSAFKTNCSRCTNTTRQFSRLLHRISLGNRVQKKYVHPSG